jgi:N-acetylmuramoyl-L-alanine amidase
MGTAMAASPFLFVYDYYVSPIEKSEPEKHKFHFQVGENVIKVNASTSKKQTLYWYFTGPSIRNASFDESGIVMDTHFLYDGDNIKIEEPEDFNEKKLSCPPIDTSDTAWKQRMFIFDPSHGENANDTGAVNSADKTFFESQLTLTIATRVGISEHNKIFTRDRDTYANMAKRESVIANSDSTALIISIHAGDSQDTGKNYIKAYYNANSDEKTREKSAKLGCIIINSILEYGKLKNKEGINGAAVVPSDSDYITKIIPAGRTGVLLELGNIQISKEDNFLSDTTHLAEAIYKGIDGYYKK